MGKINELYISKAACIVIFLLRRPKTPTLLPTLEIKFSATIGIGFNGAEINCGIVELHAF